MGLSAEQAEVVYCSAQESHRFVVTLRSGDTLEQVVQRSGLLQACPRVDLAVLRVGVFGRLRDLQDLTQPGDRVEVYRPLLADPKAARRQRAARKARAGVRRD